MFKLSFDTDNAAFDDMPELEIARILRDIANRVESGEVSGYHKALNVRDINGNVIGTFKFDPTERSSYSYPYSYEH